MIARERTSRGTTLAKTLALVLCICIFSFQAVPAANSIGRSWFPGDTFESGRSTYIDPDLQAILDGEAGGAHVRAWFIFDDHDAMATWLAVHPGFTCTPYELVPGFYFTALPRTINNLLQEDDETLIKSAWLDRAIDTKAGSKNNAPVASVSPSEPSGAGIDYLNVTHFRNATGLDGRGVIVGLLSTGIGLHPDLAGIYNSTGGVAGIKVIANVSLVDWDPLYIDINGEGTYLAGIIAGTGVASGGNYTGVAPGAQVINAKCVDAIGITIWHWAVSALEFCFKHGADIVVAGWNIIGYPGDPLTVAIQEINKRGVTVVAASGDIGPSFMTINTPGMASQSITVGAADTTGPETCILESSSRGPSLEMFSKPDVIAPGANITSCLASLDLSSYGSYGSLPVNLSTSYGTPLASNGNYTTLDTSAASAAFVAGACALLLQDNQFSRPETLKDALTRTAVDVGHDPNVQGYGMINLPAAHAFLEEHRSRISSARSFTPAMPYGGFVPNYQLGLNNRTALWFLSSYASLNFFVNLVQNVTPVGLERNVTHLMQGMFGIMHDDSFGFLLMDEVLREMHITHVGNYSRVVSVIKHGSSLAIVITGETWQESLATMRLRFDIINMGATTLQDVYLNSWFKADLDFQLDDIAGMASDDEANFIPGDDMLYINDTTRGPANESHFFIKSTHSSEINAVGGLQDTITWVQDNSTSFSPSTPSDPVDNVTLAMKYKVSDVLLPGAHVSINFSFGNGFDYDTARNKTLTALSGLPEPDVYDLAIIDMDVDRMYEVDTIVSSTCLVLNLGNKDVNQTQVAFTASRVLDNSTQTNVELWNAGTMHPLALQEFSVLWAPTYEGMYAISWVVTDQDSLQTIVFNFEDLLQSNASNLLDLINFSPENMTIEDLAAFNGSIGDAIGLGYESNPLDNVFTRDVFVYHPGRMYTTASPGGTGPSLLRPYAGVTPRHPVGKPMAIEYIGDFAIFNLTVYSAVPLTNLQYQIEGNASVTFIEDIASFANSTSTTGHGSIPCTAETGTTIMMLVDATFLGFPCEGRYVSTINFTSDQGFIDTVVVEYTIAFPRGKILFDVQHNDLLGILTGDQRDMLWGSYNQLLDVAGQHGYDLDDYIIFSDYTQMASGGLSLFELYDAVLIPDPEKPFSSGEIELLLDYYDRGGKIIVLAEPDMGNSTSPLGAGGMDFNFDFDLNGIKDLISGAGNMPDGCNITGLSQLANLFGFTFNGSYQGSASITSFMPYPGITGDGLDAIELASYATFYISGNESMNHVLARDQYGAPVAAIHENGVTGGAFLLIGDSNFIDAYHVGGANNSDFISRVFTYMLRNELMVNISASGNEIHMGDMLFLEVFMNSTVPGVDFESVLGIAAFVHPASGEMVLNQFFPTRNQYFLTFLASGGMNLTAEYSFPPFNNTGEYYVVMLFNTPRATGVYAEFKFVILEKETTNQTDFIRPNLYVLFQGVIIFSVSMSIVVLVYFNARRKQEESMHVPELDKRMAQDLDNMLMEMQSRLTVVSEEILYKKGEDYKGRVTSLEDKIKLFMKTLKKLRKFKRRMSRF